jgi:hypothetical protein
VEAPDPFPVANGQFEISEENQRDYIRVREGASPPAAADGAAEVQEDDDEDEEARQSY